ncbi:MAG: PAS domain S-box protein [Alphaproteobacteria bacterium]|nr:PAS domain S-box protein [Alphaproteobacteria bacterium]
MSRESLDEIVIGAVSEPIVAFDSSGVVLLFNPAAERLFGRGANDVVGCGIDVLMPVPARLPLSTMLASSTVGGNPIVHEVLCHSADGVAFPALVTVTRAAVSSRTGPIFVATLRDITKLKEDEAELDSSRRAAEVANVAKSEFLARMNHGLRTPLNAIIGFSEMLEEEIFGPLGSDKYREYARDIRDSGRHLFALMNNLFDMARIEVGRYELNRRMIEAASVIEWARLHARKSADDKGVTVTINLPVGMPRVYADERALRQVVQNLVANAIKYSSTGGVVEIGATADTTTLTVVVRDEGIGIAKEDQERILRPFERGRDIMHTEDGGIGLGLPLASHLVEMHGGKLWIESHLDEGTNVWFSIPRIPTIS